MRRVLLQQETHRLDLGDHDWVELKPRWTVLDRKAINDAMLTLNWHTVRDVKNGRRAGKGLPGRKREDSKVEITQTMNVYAAQVQGLRQGILAWGGPGFCVRDHGSALGEHTEGMNGCEAIPITDDAIMALDDPTSQLITRTLDDLNATPDEDEGDEEEEGDEDERPT
jgi:hypothetical protein